MPYLEKSIKAGYFDYEHLKNNTDFDNICNKKKIKALEEPLKKYDLQFLKRLKNKILKIIERFQNSLINLKKIKN